MATCPLHHAPSATARGIRYPLGARRRWRATALALAVVALSSNACSVASGSSPPAVSYVTVPDGTIAVGMAESPTGCNPHTLSGDSPGTQTVLDAVLPSPFVAGPDGSPVPNSAFIESAESVNLDPQTIVYSLNPKAVWSDGVAITASDFEYAWEQQRGNPEGSSSDVATVAGYRDIASVIGSNAGRTVTVTFTEPFADWKELFADLLPAHVFEKVGWNPSCSTVDPKVDLSGGPFEIASASNSALILERNPRWWGTPANAGVIAIHFATSTVQLAQWMASGYVQVVAPRALTPEFLAQLTGLPWVHSEASSSNTLLQLDMAASPTSRLSVTLRIAIALSINRQRLLDDQVSWAAPGLAVAQSHLFGQGQSGSTPGVPGTTSSPTTTTMPQTSSTTTTSLGAGGSVIFPLGVVPDQADAFLAAAGLVRPAGMPDYHFADGAPLVLRLVVDEGDPWAAAAAPELCDQLAAAGLDTELETAPTANGAGEALAEGLADLALVPVTVSLYLSQAQSWYTTALGRVGKNGSEDWTGYDNAQFSQLVKTASEQLNPDTAVGYYVQAESRLWEDMVALPLYFEPTVLGWSGAVAGVTPTPCSESLLWYAQFWSLRRFESTKTARHRHAARRVEMTRRSF